MAENTSTDEQARDQVAYILSRATGWVERVTTAPATAEKCSACHQSATEYREVEHKPHVCSCSTTHRPTLADPCHERVHSVVCEHCWTRFGRQARGGCDASD